MRFCSLMERTENLILIIIIIILILVIIIKDIIIEHLLKSSRKGTRSIKKRPHFLRSLGILYKKNTTITTHLKLTSNYKGMEYKSD